ncbi:MAG TPA: glycosyltransferase family 2 protein, partial [Candidatus Peribacteria bacterium]|nr:glycosyltransferase family 2 protein [Candidatus Peribacteria bacterium]
DADGQHDARDIPPLLKVLEDNNADLVIANRFGGKNAIPAIRRVFNAAGNLLTFLVTGMWLPDTQCGFKVFGPRALKQVDLKMRGFEFCTEIIREAAQYRWKVVSVPSKVMYSEYTLAKGQSFANGVRTACKILLRSFLR